MSTHIIKFGKIRLALLVVALLGWAVPEARAQSRLPCWPRQNVCPAAPCAPPCSPYAPLAPVTPVLPAPPDAKSSAAPKGPVTEQSPMAAAPIEAAPTPGPITTAALGDTMASFGPGYLDNPIPFTHFRFRYDSAFDNNRPDRADFFYPKCGSPRSIQIIDSRIDYQDFRAYLEGALSDWFSGFVEVPYRLLNPELNPNARGLADMNAGCKIALLRDEKSILTFQGRVYIPSGDSTQGLGNNHASLEPSILYANNLADKLVVFAQLGDWIPTGGTDFAGNVLLYGVGTSYTVVDSGEFRISPVIELLGWTALGGKQFLFDGGIIQDAAGDTIVNAKFGARVGFGAAGENNLLNSSDLYVGYGRALTGEVWYKDIIRAEYRLRF